MLMSWPLLSDFTSMLKNPQLGFRDPELKRCTVEMNQLGQPKARSGNFATVYRGFRPNGCEFAIRVFNRRQDERLLHYRAISQYLESHAISSIVRFEYDDQGIRSSADGKLYPLLTMEWVPGSTIFEWIEDHCRDGHCEPLLMAADRWRHLVGELSEHGVVHGDLQHGNVMVSPDSQFKLVDYDCMGVPSLLGRRNLETGLAPYQHPGRNGDTVLFSGLDNFSALVIYVALRALAAAPGLWKTYVDQPGYDRILFREEDFRSPKSSSLHQDLLNSPDELVRDLTHHLFELSRHELRDVPRLDEVVSRCESNQAAAVPARARSFRSTAFPRTRAGDDRPVPVRPRQSSSGSKPAVKATASRGRRAASSSTLGPAPPSGVSGGASPVRADQDLSPFAEGPSLRSTSAAPPAQSAAEARGEWVWWFVGSAAAAMVLGILTTLVLLLWKRL